MAAMGATWPLLWACVLPVAAWRLETRPSSALEVSANDALSGMSKVLCTRRLPYFRNRLCLEVKTHTDDLTNFVSGNSSDSSNPLVIPDLTLDLAWMGCATCTAEMRACSAGQSCRGDPKSRLHFPWVRIMPLSLKSLVAGQCVSLSNLLVTPTLSGIFLPWLGALGPYLGGLLGFATSQLLDELLLGRYCLYLTTHVAGEVVSGKKLLQDSMCIDHLYTIHIPGLFGLIKSRKVKNPESSLVCWPAAEAKASQVLRSMEAMEDDVEEEEISVPTALPEVLAHDKVCRHGASANFCVACETVTQAASWRLQALRTASKRGLQNAEKELAVVESRMLIHPNTKEQCRGDDDAACLDDYSLCVLKPGEENASSCNVDTVYKEEDLKPWCSSLCDSECSASWGQEPYCHVLEEHAGTTCQLKGTKLRKRFAVVRPARMGLYWVPCDPGPVAQFTVQWQHRLLKIVRMRRVANTTELERLNAARQVMQVFSEPSVSLPDLTMLDSLLLHLARLANGTSLSEAGKRLCRDAACCDDQSLRPYRMPPP